MKDWKPVFDCYPDAQEIFVVGDMPFIKRGEAENHAAKSPHSVTVITRASQYDDGNATAAKAAAAEKAAADKSAAAEKAAADKSAAAEKAAADKAAAAEKATAAEKAAADKAAAAEKAAADKAAAAEKAAADKAVKKGAAKKK